MSEELFLSVSPPPTPEELAAITTLFETIVRREPEAPPATADVSNWREAARREGLHGGQPWQPDGWERAARLGRR